MVQQSKLSTPITIHSLPSDVMMGIFTTLVIIHSEARFTLSPWAPGWDWITIMHICRLWRTLVLDSPSLWSHIYTDYSEDRLKLHLDRSKNADLIVDFVAEGGTAEVNSKLLEVLNHLDRISTLRVVSQSGGKEWWGGLAQKLSCPAPRLRYLSFTRISHRGNEIQLVLPTVGSSLRRFVIAGFKFPSSAHLPINLTYLCLSKVTNLTTSSLLSCLKACTGMKELILADLELTSNGQFGGTVSMPLLQLLRVRAGITSNFWTDIHEYFVLPSNLNWHYMSFSDDFETLSKLLKVPLQCREMTIDIMLHGVEMHSKCLCENNGTPKPYSDNVVCSKEFQMFFDATQGSHSCPALNTLGSLIKSSYLATAKSFCFSIDLDETTVLEEEWIQLLQPLSHTKSVQIVGFGGESVGKQIRQTFASALGHQIQSNCSVPVICPALEELTLGLECDVSSDQDFIGGLGDNLRRRKELGYGVKKVSIGGSVYKQENLSALLDCADEVTVIGQLPTRTSARFQ